MSHRRRKCESEIGGLVESSPFRVLARGIDKLTSKVDAMMVAIDGGEPFGWEYDRHGELIENPSEQNVIRLIAQCRKAGVPWKRIAKILLQACADQNDRPPRGAA